MDMQFTSGDTLFILLTTMIGLAVLVMGRQIFWVFIAGLGFALGIFLSSEYFKIQHEWQVFIIGVIIAVIGVLLAYTLERLAASIAGFATGWFLTVMLLSYFDLNFGQIEPWIPYIIGFISAGLLWIYYDWGVIIASSLAGSAIILNGVALARNLELTVLFVFSLTGIIIQAIWLMQEK